MKRILEIEKINVNIRDTISKPFYDHMKIGTWFSQTELSKSL